MTEQSTHNVYGAKFWAAAPEYDTVAFWTMVVAQKGEMDAYSRELLICGRGACGPILCTRQYAESRMAQAKGLAVAERRIAGLREGARRAMATRRAKEAGLGARIRAIQDRALAKMAQVLGEG